MKLRQSTGFISSLFLLLNKSYLPIPDYSTLCRRQHVVPTEIETRLNQGENLVAGIDSTGLKVYEDGEWKVRKHGWSKHRTWRKLHVCADLTGNNEDDASVGGRMLKGSCAGIKSFKGDGACDRFVFREVLGNGVEQVIPPPGNAVVQLPGKKMPLPDCLTGRNKDVEYINKEGSKAWK